MYGYYSRKADSTVIVKRIMRNDLAKQETPEAMAEADKEIVDDVPCLLSAVVELTTQTNKVIFFLQFCASQCLHKGASGRYNNQSHFQADSLILRRTAFQKCNKESSGDG